MQNNKSSCGSEIIAKKLVSADSLRVTLNTCCCSLQKGERVSIFVGLSKDKDYRFACEIKKISIFENQSDNFFLENKEVMQVVKFISNFFQQNRAIYSYYKDGVCVEISPLDVCITDGSSQNMMKSTM